MLCQVASYWLKTSPWPNKIPSFISATRMGVCVWLVHVYEPYSNVCNNSHRRRYEELILGFGVCILCFDQKCILFKPKIDSFILSSPSHASPSQVKRANHIPRARQKFTTTKDKIEETGPY